MVAFNGHLVARLDRDQAVEAVALQFGLIWVYGIDYSEKKSKKHRGCRNYYEFSNYKFWDNKPESKGSSKAKRAGTEVQKLIDKIDSHQKA